ncbi:MAG TPA: hypothetical protein DHW49_05495, partial [Anaerolineae bacterium]|nr:hypothetical protein [Anaerolineae bacterium]
MLTLAQLLRIPNVDNGLRFSISPDGNQVVFAWNKTEKWELHALSLRAQSAKQSPSNDEVASSGEHLLATTLDGSKFSPKHSSNRKHLAYVVDYDGSESYHIILHNLQNNSIINLTPNSGYAHQPNFDFSPDGKQLAILSDES